MCCTNVALVSTHIINWGFPVSGLAPSVNCRVPGRINNCQKEKKVSTKFARLSSSTNGTENLMDDRTFRFYSVRVELKTGDIEMIFDMRFCRSRSNYKNKNKRILLQRSPQTKSSDSQGQDKEKILMKARASGQPLACESAEFWKHGVH